MLSPTRHRGWLGLRPMSERRQTTLLDVYSALATAATLSANGGVSVDRNAPLARIYASKTRALVAEFAARKPFAKRNGGSNVG